MTRTARVVLPGYPHHVVHRGHNRGVVFADKSEYVYYLRNLAEFKQAFRCEVYAYCLMTNHVHLIVNPGQAPENLARLMKRVAGRQTRYANRVRNRTGTLWEGRYRSSPIQRETHLLACSRYVELNPVRARMVARPEAYPWSSYVVKAGVRRIGWLDLDPAYLALGSTDIERQRAYREWVRDRIPEGEWEHIRRAAQRGQLTGGLRFVDQVHERTGKRIESRGPGRPPSGRK